MKKVIAIVLAMMMVIGLAVVVMAADSPERDVTEVATKADLPTADEDSPDFVHVKDEDVTYAKYNNPLTGWTYVEEGAVPKTYTFTGDEVVIGNPLTVKSSADFALFVAVYVDKAEVDSANYEAVSGSTIITFSADYIAGLKTDVEHEVVIESADGFATGTIKVLSKDETPQTGDNSITSILLAIVLVSIGAIGVVSVSLLSKKNRAEK